MPSPVEDPAGMLMGTAKVLDQLAYDPRLPFSIATYLLGLAQNLEDIAEVVDVLLEDQ